MPRKKQSTTLNTKTKPTISNNAPCAAPLTDLQRDVLAIVRAGCPRATAGHCVGWNEARWTDELQQSETFRNELLRTEAALEANHLRNVQAAAQDKRNWRASVWWLEHRFPERYASQTRPKNRPA